MNYGAVYENAVAQELLCHGFEPFYYNSKKLGELDFVVSQDSVPLPIEVKSGKDFHRHNALTNVMSCAEFGIRQALVLCNGNMESEDKIIYAPVYMTMFLKKKEVPDSIYRIDLSGLR